MSRDNKNNDIILEEEDYTGKKVIFTRKKWEEKKPDHPELEKEAFLECIKRAIKNPDEVWQDYEDYVKNKQNRRCHYKKYSADTYAKVVIWFKSNPCEVITAYGVDYIKEQKYKALKRFV